MRKLLALLALATLCGCSNTHAWIPWGVEVRAWCDAETWFVPTYRCEECGKWRYDEAAKWQYEE